MDDPPLGTIVTVPQGRGVIRFKGTTSFKATGKWIGIELYEKNGKNDGSVEGISYFRCEPGHGVFVRPSQIKTVHGSELDSVGGTERVFRPADPIAADRPSRRWPPTHT